MHHIWTDGSSLGNPGPSGWAALIDGEMISGTHGFATNNEAEIVAVYHGIISLSPGDYATIHTDSKLIIGWFLRGWQINNPRIGSYKRIIDQVVIMANLHITFVHTKGHAADYNNLRVDSMARKAAKEARMSPYNGLTPQAY